VNAPAARHLAGTVALARRDLRQDRAGLGAWALGLSGFTALVTTMSAAMTPRELLEETEFMAGSPGLRLTGLPLGASAGSYTMVRAYLTLAVLAAIMNIQVVVRNTRRSEEEGITELLTSCPVGRHAPAAAALLLALCSDLALTPLIALAMTAAGQPVAGSLTAAAAIISVGLVFAGLAAVTAQLAATARGALALAGSALALAVLACGLGNLAGRVRADGVRVDSAWPAWLSPLGWGQQTRPFDGENPWPLALSGACFLACTGAAALMLARRDLGSGLLSHRPGRSRAPRYLHGPLGLALRLHRGTIAGWAVATSAFGAVLGAAAEQIDDLSGSSLEWYTRLAGTQDVHAAFQSSMVQMAGMLVTVHTVQLLLRLRGEEASGHLENVLTAAVGRSRWVLGHLLVACASAAGLLVAFALTLGVVGGGGRGDATGWTAALLPACLAQLPSCLLVGAAVTALVALVPRRAAAVSWTGLPVLLLIGPLFGPDLGLPAAVRDLSPFTHLPQAPAAPIEAVPLLGLLAAGAVLTALALAALRRRDLLAAG